MTESHGETRRWQSRPPRRGRGAGHWRRAAGMTPPAQRRARRTRRALVGLGVGVIGAAILYLLLMPTAPPPAVLVHRVETTRDSLLLPPYPHEPPPLLKAEKKDDEAARSGPFHRSSAELSDAVRVSESAGAKTLVAYVALFAGADADEAFLLQAVGDEPQRKSISQFLHELRRAPVENILLAVEGELVGAHWRTGMLSGNFLQRLEALSEESQQSEANVCVIATAGRTIPGWRSSDRGTLSPFADALFAGLQQEADGSGPAGRKNGRITTDELYSYMAGRLDSADRTDGSAAPRLVRWGRDFEILGTGRTMNDAGTSPSDADEKDRTEADEGDQGSEDEEEIDPFRKLNEFWSARDKLRNGDDEEGRSPPSSWSPHRWKKLQARLLLAERQLRCGFVADARLTFDEIETDLRNLRRDCTPRGLSDTGNRGMPVSLELVSSPESSALSDEQRRRLDEILSAIPRAEIGSEEPPPPYQRLDMFLSTLDLQQHAEARSVLMRWVIETVREDCSRPLLRRLGPLLNVLRPSDWPQELAFAAQLIRRAGRDPDANWPADPIREVLDVQRAVNALVRSGADADPLIRETLLAADRARIAAERWLLTVGTTGDYARNSIQRAKERLKLSRDVRDAVRLRDRLLIELPDWARWAADVAAEREISVEPGTAPGDGLRETAAAFRDYFETQARAESWSTLENTLDTWPEATDAARLQGELLRLFAAVHRMNAILQHDPAARMPEKRERLKRLVESAQRVRTAEKNFRGMADRVLRNLQETNDRRGIDAALRVPWWTARQRQDLLRELEHLPNGAPKVVVAEKSSAGAGLWQGFWAVQTLSLSGLETGRIVRLWEQWGTQMPGEETDPAQWTSRMDDLGRAIRQAWDDVRRGADRWDNPRWHRLAWSVPPSDRLTRIPDEKLKSDRESRMKDWREGRIEIWQRQQDFWSGAEIARVYEELLRRVEARRSGQQHPSLGQLEAPVFDGTSRQASLRITYQAGGIDPGRLSVLFFPGRRVNVRCNGSPVAGPQSLPPPDQALECRLELPDEVRTEQNLVVALVKDGLKDGIPVDVQTIRVTPPPNPDEWQIEFVTAEGDREVPTRGNEPMRLLLPPESPEEGFALKTRLKTPEGGTHIRDATVSVYARTPEGTKKPQPVTQLEIDIEADARDIPLPFSAAAPSEGNGGSAPAGPEFPVDISHGLVFEITPEGAEKPLTSIVMQPVFWSAEHYLRVPRPEFRDGALVFRLDAANWLDDGLSPEQIEIRLRSRRGHEQPAELKSGEPSRLTVPLAQLAQAEETSEVLAWSENRLVVVLPPERGSSAERSLPVTMDVAGLPRALRWEVDPEGQVRRVVPWMGISLVPPSGPPPAPLRARFEILHPGLGTDTQGTLEYRLTQPGSELSRGTEDDLRSDEREVVRLKEPSDGLWRVTTAAGDYEAVLEPATAPGRYTLHAELSLPQGDRLQQESSLTFAIDDAGGPDTVQLTVPRAAHNVTNSLPISVRAADAQSGIREIAVGIDADENRMLDEEERLAGVPLRQLPREADERLSIPSGRLPRKSGTARVLVRVTNGVGKTKTVSDQITLQIPESRKPPMTGSLVVRADSRIYRIILEGPSQRDEKYSAARAQKSVTLENLDPGSYQVTAVGYLNRQGKGSVEVEAGRQPATIELQLR